VTKRARRFFTDKDGKNKVWVATLIGQTITTSTVAINLVADDDYFGGTGQAHATIIGMRGWLAITPVLPGSGDIIGYIGVTDENVPSGDPSVAASYVNEDIMFTFGQSAMNEAVAGFNESVVMQINVKAKRKIRTGEDCRIPMISTTVNGWRVAGVIRTLLLLNNS